MTDISFHWYNIPEAPKCIFCDDVMRHSGSTVSGFNGLLNKEHCRFHFDCINDSCLVLKDFPRYLFIVDGYNNIVSQEYAINDDYYVKVFKDVSLIYHLQGCFLLDEVKIPRALWLNSTNIPQTLDKLKLMITFS